MFKKKKSYALESEQILQFTHTSLQYIMNQVKKIYLTISTRVAHSNCFSFHCGSSQSSS